MAALSKTEVQLWRFWREDREKFRKLGVWGGDANGEIGQGKSLSVPALLRSMISSPYMTWTMHIVGFLRIFFLFHPSLLSFSLEPSC